MKKILLTGGSGFIGKNILESYLFNQYEIIAPKSFELNLTDKICVEEFFKDKNFDVVIHCAAKPSHRNASAIEDVYCLNLKMFENLESQKDKYNKFINIGSGAIYDLSTNISDAKEEDILKCPPQNEFSCCKASVYEKIQNLKGFIDLNIFGIFGKYEDYSIRFISNAICKTLFDLPITIKQNRCFSYLYVEDLMPILEFFIENSVKHKSYNIVTDEKIELFKIAQIVKNISQKDLKIKVQKEGLGLDYTGSNKRLREEFKDIRYTDINISVERLYNWYVDNKKSLDKELLLSDK